MRRQYGDGWKSLGQEAYLGLQARSHAKDGYKPGLQALRPPVYGFECDFKARQEFECMVSVPQCRSSALLRNDFL